MVEEAGNGASTRQLILEAVVTCIEKVGFDKLTIRKIAREAGVNIASINYHFRSKDELLAETLNMTIHHMMEDVLDTLDRREPPFSETLREVLYYLIEGGLRFPGIVKAQFYGAVVEHDYSGISVEVMREVFERLVARATEAYPAQPAEKLRVTLAQVMTSIMFMMLAPGYLPLGDDLDTLDESACHALAAHYVALFQGRLGD